MGESNISSKHWLGSRLESHKRKTLEANWLVRSSDLHGELIEIMRTKNIFMESRFQIVIVFFSFAYRTLLLSICAREAEPLTVTPLMILVRVIFSNKIEK